MNRDITTEDAFKLVESFFQRVQGHGRGGDFALGAPAVRPGGREVAFAAWNADKGGPRQHHIMLADITTGDVRAITQGAHQDRDPCWSPDGQTLAFLSDRPSSNGCGLFLLGQDRMGDARPVSIPGHVAEAACWSPDGRSLLTLAAALDADQGPLQGAKRSNGTADSLVSWLPEVSDSYEAGPTRRLWLVDPVSLEATRVPIDQYNIWEACWCGPDRIAAIASSGSRESDWYDARLMLFDANSGQVLSVYESTWSLGCPAASPDGKWLAVIEAIASDRGVIAGDMVVIDVARWHPQPVQADGVDVTFFSWRNDDALTYAGLRAQETVIGDYQPRNGRCRQLWASGSETCGMVAPLAVPLHDGQAVAMVESYRSLPEIHVLDQAGPRRVANDRPMVDDALLAEIGSADTVSWVSRDGTSISGVLIKPNSPGPHPLITELHGGPCWAVRSRWMGDMRPERLFLVSRGYALFFPNYRGSTGRGRPFVEDLRNTVGERDADDVMSGIDYLTASGIVDPDRLGLMGASYGGFLTCWLVTQETRFAAAVAISPITDWLSQHWTANVSRFDEIFLAGDVTDATSQYMRRSPAFVATPAATPTLLIAGAKDRSTPADQAREFQRALLSAGVKSSLIIYPEEGHGVRAHPATLDAAARIANWFETNMPSGNPWRPLM